MGQTYVCVDNVWRPCSSSIVNVKYMSSYGTVPPQEITLSSIAVTIPSCGTRIGYDFLGWSAINGSSTAEYTTGNTYYFSKNTTLYAVWKVQTFTLTRYRGGIVYSTNTTTYGTYLTAGSCIDLSSEKIFEGWSTNALDPTVVYNAESRILMNSNKNLYAVYKYQEIYTQIHYLDYLNNITLLSGYDNCIVTVNYSTTLDLIKNYDDGIRYLCLYSAGKYYKLESSFVPCLINGLLYDSITIQNNYSTNKLIDFNLIYSNLFDAYGDTITFSNFNIDITAKYFNNTYTYVLS